MRRFLLAFIAMVALLPSGLASATGPQGVYGTGVQRFDNVYAEGSFTLSLSATTLPSGEVVGHHNIVLQYKRPDVSFHMLRAKPIYVETDGQTACVVSEVTRLIGWGFQPVLTTAKIVDVRGGPDLFGSSNTGTNQDPRELCSFLTASGPITDGNFTIAP